MSYAMKKQFYSPPFLSPKSERSLQEFGILPKLEGIYRFDQNPPSVDAVFISHGHLDHSAYLSFIKREIPVHCGETTRTILKALSEIRRVDLEFSVADIDFKTFRTGKKIKVDDLEVEPFHVDHSVPGAYGFVIHTSNGAVVYTGDFRDHGAKPEMTSEFVENAKNAEPVAVITEATNMTGATVSSEAEVEAKLQNIVSAAEGVVLAEFAYSDVDRLNSFYHIVKKTGRCLAVSLKQAHLLESLRKDKGLSIPDLDDEAVLVFRKSKKRFDKWENELIERYAGSNKVFDVFEVSKRQCKVVLAMSFYDFEELVSLQPSAGSCYILSASEPFNEEMEIDYEKLTNWLSHYGLPQYHVHVSGHMMPLQLKKALKTMDAKKVFPVHTERAGLFAKFMRDLKGEVTLVEKCKEYKL
jgi:ribonuclease J